jgi:hypothetical protein
MNPNRTADQQAVVARLVQSFNIQGEKVLFLNDADPLEPWLNSKALLAIARQSGEFKQVATTYSEYINDLRQIVWSATVVNLQDQGFTRSGVAKLGEKLPNEEEPDEHDLAASRALRAALDDAGFDPTKAAPCLNLKLPPDQHAVAHEKETRLNDLRRIHKIAGEKGLIVPKVEDASRNDDTAYRGWLVRYFGVNTTAAMGPADRARVINALTDWDPSREPAQAAVA